jgi:hypothetical protein
LFDRIGTNLQVFFYGQLWKNLAAFRDLHQAALYNFIRAEVSDFFSEKFYITGGGFNYA